MRWVPDEKLTKEQVLAKYKDESYFFEVAWPYEFVFDMEVEHIVSRLTDPPSDDFERWSCGYDFCHICDEDIDFAIAYTKESFITSSDFDNAVEMMAVWEVLVRTLARKPIHRDAEFTLLGEILHFVSPEDLYDGVYRVTWDNDFIDGCINDSYKVVEYDGDIYFMEP